MTNLWYVRSVSEKYRDYCHKQFISIPINKPHRFPFKVISLEFKEFYHSFLTCFYVMLVGLDSFSMPLSIKAIRALWEGALSSQNSRLFLYRKRRKISLSTWGLIVWPGNKNSLWTILIAFYRSIWIWLLFLTALLSFAKVTLRTLPLITYPKIHVSSPVMTTKQVRFKMKTFDEVLTRLYATLLQLFWHPFM